MNEQLKSKIEVAILSAMINGMINYRGDISDQEMMERKDMLVKELYDVFASYEPKNESEAV